MPGISQMYPVENFDHKSLVLETACDRLDKSLPDLLAMSRSQIQQLIKLGHLYLNQKPARAKDKGKVGDLIDLYIPKEVPLDLVPENLPLEVVYEDQDLVVINKASGMVVHPSAGHEKGTLVNALLYHIQGLSTGTGLVRPGLVHRIDKDTSGLLVVAKNNEAHQALSQELANHHMERTYLALVHGQIPEDRGTINAPLARDKNNRLKWSVQEGGKEAITHFKVLERFDKYSLVQLNLETGRTHQIRAHMLFIGYPLVGDPVYSSINDDKSFGQYLHAASLSFKHPTTGQEMRFEAPLPDVFAEKVASL